MPTCAESVEANPDGNAYRAGFCSESAKGAMNDDMVSYISSPMWMDGYSNNQAYRARPGNAVHIAQQLLKTTTTMTTRTMVRIALA